MKQQPVQPLLEEIAQEFWKPLLSFKSFPVDIERVVALCNLPIIIILLPNLTIREVQQWIINNNFPILLPNEDKSLHGFLLAYKGQGIIFVNGTDTPEERRFTIAHELAHFLLDYQLKRQHFISSFGQSITTILDGERPPSLTERLWFITSDLPSPFLTHHLDSQNLTAFDRHLVWKAEKRTDALATELLAPYREVFERITINKDNSFRVYEGKIITELSSTFGLPVNVSQEYARHFARCITGGNSISEELGLV